MNLIKLILNSFYMSTKCKLKLEMDSYYSENEIIEMEMVPLNNHGMDYLIYKKDSKVYFFERVSKDLLRLFCITSKQSFYLS